MKRYILVILFLGSIFSINNLFAQGKCERKVTAKASPLITPRGGNQKIKVDMKNGQRVFLSKYFLKKQTKIPPKCMISLANEINQEVDVYVDGNYMGSIKPSVTGVIESLEAYSEVYCVTADKDICWTENGDCNCTYVFKLAKEVK